MAANIPQSPIEAPLAVWVSNSHTILLKVGVHCSFNTATIWEQNPRSHHKGATGRVRTGNQPYPVLCLCQLGQDIPQLSTRAPTLLLQQIPHSPIAATIISLQHEHHLPANQGELCKSFAYLLTLFHKPNIGVARTVC